MNDAIDRIEQQQADVNRLSQQSSSGHSSSVSMMMGGSQASSLSSGTAAQVSQFVQLGYRPLDQQFDYAGQAALFVDQIEQLRTFWSREAIQERLRLEQEEMDNNPNQQNDDDDANEHDQVQVELDASQRAVLRLVQRQLTVLTDQQWQHNTLESLTATANRPASKYDSRPLLQPGEQVTLILGPAGSGKSLLLNRMRQQIKQHQQARNSNQRTDSSVCIQRFGRFQSRRHHDSQLARHSTQRFHSQPAAHARTTAARIAKSLSQRSFSVD